MKNGPWDQDGRREIYKKAELSYEDHIYLKEYSDSINIPFFSSVFSIPDAEMLAKVQNNYVKIASFESRNIELIKICDKLFDTIFISTGTTSIDWDDESSINKWELSTIFSRNFYPITLCRNVGFSPTFQTVAMPVHVRFDQ